jgi:putative colanic acid biosynthesis UDP-glucose lipid carrier transferase
MIVRLRTYAAYLRILTYFLPVFAYLIAGSTNNAILELFSLPYLSFLAILSLIWITICEHQQLFTVESLLRERTSLLVSGFATVATYTVVGMTLYFSADSAVPREFVVISGVALLVLVSTSRIGFRISLHKLSIRRPARVLVVGTDHFARRAAKRIRHIPFGKCVILGYVRLPGAPIVVMGSPTYELREVAKIDPSTVDEIVLAVPFKDSEKIAGVMRYLEHIPSPVRAVIDLGSNLVVRETLYQIGRLQLLDLAMGPIVRWEYRVAKRTFDIIFASLALVITCPLMAVLACAVKLSSRGPILFKQERVGLHGKLFTMLKFRSMRVGAAGEGDVKWTVENDPRCTPIGAFLRKTSLDELPQFVNVLRGEMSVVGPRPERPYYVRKFREEVNQYSKRHTVKVGITGWAQVNGWRGDTSIERRIEHDLYYMQNWSLFLDLKIIFITVMRAMWGENAY